MMAWFTWSCPFGWLQCPQWSIQTGSRRFGTPRRAAAPIAGVEAAHESISGKPRGSVPSRGRLLTAHARRHQSATSSVKASVGLSVDPMVVRRLGAGSRTGSSTRSLRDLTRITVPRLRNGDGQQSRPQNVGSGTRRLRPFGSTPCRRSPGWTTGTEGPLGVSRSGSPWRRRQPGWECQERGYVPSPRASRSWFSSAVARTSA
jgi:hypothetical protein